MNVEWKLFGAWHLGILAAIPLAGFLFSRLCRAHPRTSRYLLAAAIAVNELIWYSYRLREEGFRFPEGLPLQLCDVMVWLTVFSLIAMKQAVFEFAFFAGISGAFMALLTPDLWAPFCSYPSIYFFLAHGLVVSALLMLVWSGLIRPKPGCVWRALLVLNCYALAVGLFNLYFHTNYMYLCEKPDAASLLDYLGPWPWYILAAEIPAIALFSLLWLPFRRR